MISDEPAPPPITRDSILAWLRVEGFWSFVLPLLIFYGMRPRLGPGGALVAASLAPLGAFVIGWVRERRVRPAALIVAVSALAGAALALSFRDARAIVYKDMAMDSLWGIAFLTFALLPSQPLHRWAAPVAGWLRRGATVRDWNAPRVRSTLRRLLLLWACQSFVFALSKVLCLYWFGLDGYLLSTILFRVFVQTLVTVLSVLLLGRALGEVMDSAEKVS